MAQEDQGTYFLLAPQSFDQGQHPKRDVLSKEMGLHREPRTEPTLELRQGTQGESSGFFFFFYFYSE